MLDIEIVEAIKAEITNEFQIVDFISGIYETPNSLPAALVAITGSAPIENNSEIYGNPIILIALFDKNTKDATLHYKTNLAVSNLNKRLYSVLNCFRNQTKISFNMSNIDNETLKIQATNAGDSVVSSITITIK
ncbi:MAG TPA: hypothetical protein DCS19_09345 [Flavobacterium sp.]|nr:hypothetical protein [Flavobacterium sp.]